MRYNVVFLILFFLSISSKASFSKEAEAITIKEGNNGYKDIRFGISPDTLFKMKKCDLSKDPSSAPIVEFYICNNFLVGGQPRPAAFIFLNKKLKRIHFQLHNVSNSELDSVILALNKKYGVPVVGDPNDKIDDFKKGKFPQLFFFWSESLTHHPTKITATAWWNPSKKISVSIVYSEENFDSEFEQLKTQGLKDDL